MTNTADAAVVLRSLGLVVDGPVRWGGPVSSRAPGVFVVEADRPTERPPIDPTAVRRWIERASELRLDGERPTQTELAERLASFWLADQTILYVGRTLKSLGARVGAMYATPLGDRRPHPGGYWLKTLADLPRLRVWWAETDAPEEHEDALLDAFAAAVGEGLDDGRALPWAVLESPSGIRKATGITGPLLSPEESAARPAAPGAGSSSSARKTPRKTRSGSAASGPARPRTRATRDAAAAPAPQETHVTADGLAALEEELVRLVSVERPGVIERVKHARELGDLRENADYEAARNEQSFLEGRIRDLEARIRTAVLIESNGAGVVTRGSTVVVEHGGDEMTLTIVGSTEADPAIGRISSVSPVGRGLLGRRAGDEVVIRTPSHETRYRVVSVS
jgi:transcription elongation factor GreA